MFGKPRQKTIIIGRCATCGDYIYGYKKDNMSEYKDHQITSISAYSFYDPINRDNPDIWFCSTDCAEIYVLKHRRVPLYKFPPLYNKRLEQQVERSRVLYYQFANKEENL